MMTEKQEKMWEAIVSAHPTAEEVMTFFSNYCGLQIFDDEMWEYLVRYEYLEDDEEEEEPDLPDELTVGCEEIYSYWEELDEKDKSDMISDYLSNEYDYGHEGFDYEELKNGDIHITNIQWDTEE